VPDPIRAALWTPANHWANPAAEAIFARTAALLGWNIAGAPDADVLFNFLRRQRIPSDLCPRAINIHPASSKYPGVGGASRAILEGDTEFGACAHFVTEQYDEGDVVWESTFRLDAGISAEQLLHVAEMAALAVLHETMAIVKRHGGLRYAWPSADCRPWRGLYCSRAQLREMMTARPDGDVDRVVRAFRFPGKPGPYVRVGKHLFSLVTE
jgi:methionyl-tRNA formyltransferase